MNRGGLENVQIDRRSAVSTAADPRAAIAAGVDRPEDWSRLCESACRRNCRGEAMIAFKNADFEDQAALRILLVKQFGKEITNDLPSPPFAGLKTPWRDAYTYPYRAGGGYGIAAGTLFFVVTAKLFGPVGIALGGTALLLHHVTVLRSSLAGEEEPPYPAEFPSLAFGTLILPAAIIVAFAPMLFGFAMAFGVSAERAGAPILTLSAAAPFLAFIVLLLSAPGILISIAWERYHSVEALRPAVFAEPILKKPAESAAVLIVYLCAMGFGFVLLALAPKANIILSVLSASAAQFLFIFSARRCALLSRATSGLL